METKDPLSYLPPILILSQMNPVCSLSTLLTAALIWSSYLCLGPPGNSFPSDFLTTFCTHFWRLLWYLAKSTNYEASRFTIFSKLLSLPTFILLSNAHSNKLLGRRWGNEGHTPEREFRTYSSRTEGSIFEGWILPVGESFHTPSRRNLSVSLICVETESLWA
jgi:hypothetical protein